MNRNSDFDSDIKNDKILFSHSRGYQQISPEIDNTKCTCRNATNDIKILVAYLILSTSVA